MLKKITLIVLFVFLLNTSTTFAKDYYVSTSGNNSNSGESTTNAWKTIQYAVTNPVIQPGDTINVMAGEYPEEIQINNSNGSKEGQKGLPITLKSYDLNNKARLTGQQNASQIKIFNRSYWTIEGLAFINNKNGGIWARADSQNVVGIKVQNCYFDGQTVPSFTNLGLPHVIVFDGKEPYSVSYSYILNNRVGNVVTGPAPDGRYNEAITIHHNVKHVLVKDNVVENSSYLTFDVIGKTGGGLPEYIIFDNNLVQSVKRDTMGNNNAFKIDGADYILFQNNKSIDADGIVNGVEPWSDTYKQEYTNHIWRNNIVDTRNGGSGNWGLTIGGNRFPYNGQIFTNGIMSKSYIVNNTIVVRDNGMYLLFYGPQNTLRLKNNVFWRLSGNAMSQRNQFAVQGDSAKMQAIGWEANGNLWYTPTANPYWEWGKVGENYSGFASYKSAKEPNSVWGQPVFTSATNYTLTSASPGFQAGVNLTTSTNSGNNSTNLVVADAGYFIDGWGLVEGDLIAVGSQTNRSRITSVNYSNDTITLETPLTWSNGSPVNYAQETNNPTIGYIKSLEKVTPVMPEPTPVFDPKFDLDDNGAVNILDIIELVKYFFR